MRVHEVYICLSRSLQPSKHLLVDRKTTISLYLNILIIRKRCSKSEKSISGFRHPSSKFLLMLLCLMKITVTVLRGSVQLHKFSGIRQLQVFNHTERHLTFSGNATEEIFPGFGRLFSLHHYTICKYSGFSWSIPLAMSYKHGAPFISRS